MIGSRWLRWGLISGVTALVVLLVISFWLLRTNTGRDWALTWVIDALPEGATLQWKQVDGVLYGPLELRDVRFEYQGTIFSAQRLRLEHRLRPLFSKRLELQSLVIEHSLLILPVDDSPLEMPRWPDFLPLLDAPISVSVSRLQASDFQIRRVDQSIANISRIDASFALSPGALQVDKLIVASDRGSLNLSGNYLPGSNYRTSLTGSVAFPAVSGAAPAQATLIAKGNLDDFLFSLDGRAPAPISLRLQLKDGSSTPNWRLDANSKQLSPQRIGLSDSSSYAFDVHVTGTAGDAKLQGNIARDELSAVINPSRLNLDQGVITVKPLALTLAEGPVSLSGTLALEGDSPQFDLLVSSKALRLSPRQASADSPSVSGSGELRVAGHWDDWTVAGDAALVRDGKQATLTVAGRGDSKHLSLDSLLAKTPNGQISGAAELGWQPSVRAKIQAELSGFDPGYFFPDYPGQLSGTLDARAERDPEERWHGDAKLVDLRGELRNRQLQGQAQLRFDGQSGDGELSLHVGDSQVEASGSYGEQIDFQAQFAPLELADLISGASGRLQGRIAAHGKRAMPSFEADIDGSGLAWAGMAAGHLSAKGQLPASGRDGVLELMAEGLRYQDQAFDGASLKLTGSIEAFTAEGNVGGELGILTTRVTVAGQGQRWNGSIERLRFSPGRGAAWTLNSPVGYQYQTGHMQFERACFQADIPSAPLCLEANDTEVSVSGAILPLAVVEPWLPESAVDLQAFGEFQLDGKFVRQEDGWDGRAQLRSAVGGLQANPESPRDVFRYSDLRLDANLEASNLTLELDLNLRSGGSISGHLQTPLSANAPLQAQLQLDMRQLAWMELLSTDIAAPSGELSGNLFFAGPPGELVVTGDARLARFTAELPSLGVTLRDGDFSLQGKAHEQARITGRVTSGKGQLLVAGSLDLSDPGRPLEVSLRGDDIEVVNTPDMEATMSPDLQMSYADGTLKIRGSVLVPTARVDLERLDNSVSISADVVVLDPREPRRDSAFLVDTDVELRLGERVRMRGFGLDGTLGGSLRMRDRPNRAPQASGTLEVGGIYTAYGRNLNITRGRLSFVNSAYDNPALDIRAEHQFEDVTVGVRVRGSALAPQTAIVSEPAMPTSEALSWLIFGQPLSNTTGTQAEQVGASALALNVGSNLLAGKIGSHLGLDSAGISESRALGGSAFMFGKQLSPRLFVGYGVALAGTGQVLVLKYLLAHGLNVSFESAPVGTTGSINWRKEK